MPLTITCVCGKSYNLKDEFAGRSVKCPACGHVMKAPASLTPAGDGSVFDRNKFLLRQKKISLQEKYYIWNEEGKEIMFVERPRHYLRGCGALLAGIVTLLLIAGVAAGIGAAIKNTAGEVILVVGIVAAFVAMIAVIVWISPKRHVTFYKNDTKSERLLEILQENKLQILNAYYTVRDPGGNVLARFRKNYLFNIIRKRWYLLGPGGELIGYAKEDSVILSLLRRLLGNLAVFMRTNFVIMLPDHQTVIGEFNRKFTLFDRYVLDMSADPSRQLDRRVAAALGVMLDTGERR